MGTDPISLFIHRTVIRDSDHICVLPLWSMIWILINNLKHFLRSLHFLNFLCRIYTFARGVRRIARQTTGRPNTYSPRHSLRHSPRLLWRSFSKRFFKHESKGTNGDARYVYEHVNFCTRGKKVHSQRDRCIWMFVQVARRGTSMNV